MSPSEAYALEAAIQIAVAAHRGQRDKAQAPYILHVLRVMLSVHGSVAQQAAVLHDSVEDTEVTFEDLIAGGVASEAVEAVRLLTHDPAISYSEYVCRLKADPVATAVKLADLQDNYRLDRVAYRAEHAAEDARRIQKYILTRQFLCDEVREAEYRERMKPLEFKDAPCEELDTDFTDETESRS